MRSFAVRNEKRSGALAFAVAVVLLLAMMIPCGIYAMGPSSEEVTYIFDEAGLFTEEQYRNLQEQAMSISNYSQCGVYFIAVNDFADYSVYGDILMAAEDIYLTNDFGYGPEKNGILLLLSMDYRDYALVTYGSFANAAFTDYGQEVLCDHFLDDFANDHWYGGVLDYLLDCEQMTDMAMAGTPLDVQGPPAGSEYEDYYNSHPSYDSVGNTGTQSLMTSVPLALVPSAAIALLICSILKRKMKTARRQVAAFEYIVDGQVDFRVRQDRFTHVTRRRRKINTNNGPKAGGGGGGTTVRSSGFSGRSGKF